ncbi:TonB-dependent receptor [Permianibacter aggregans]|uniref:Iron complex outermembrane receptor protein n=1 Tax=Permianibacter aggregans TaxID=1510150 RepID=A0A4R6UPL5_9GAMM|nr:TonB-dependent receptor [Permianibacter aggregans]QGX39719.1 TonB-dependent receptor [Permianibacter aggregans]TDQ47165.1 iron complex outermembrane receptor protein [Permianibacter aggregans]
MIKRRCEFPLSLLSLCVAALLSPVATAAEQPDQDSTTEENQDRKGAEVITVTAQKRTERIQDVPITMNAYSERTVRNLGALNIKDLGAITPGMDADNLSVTQPRFEIRGIGTSDFGIGSDPAVAVYIDGVYVGRSGAAQMNFNDIQRVEILKGPQGTLFGRNAGAGAIHIISRLPRNENGGELRVTLGEYLRQTLEGAVNLSNNDDLHARFSFVDHKMDGYIDQVGSDTKLGLENSEGARFQLLWNASDDTDLIFRGEYESTDQDAVQGASTNPAIAPADPFGAYATDMDSNESRDLWGASLTLEHRMDNQQFTSITAYRTFDSNNFEEEDGSADPRFFLATNNVEDFEALSQEFRLTGSNDSFKWSLGAMYAKERARQTHNVHASTDVLDTFFLSDGGVPPTMIPSVPAGFGIGGFFYQQLNPLLMAGGLPNGWDDVAMMLGMPTGLAAATAYANINLGKPWLEQMHDRGDFESYAVYADATWSATEKLDITLGVRYTVDEKTFQVDSEYTNTLDLSGGVLSPGTILNCGGPAPGCMDFGGGNYAQVLIFDTPLVPLVAQPIPFGLIFVEQIPGIKNSEEWDAVTPRFVVDYEWSPNVMTFITAANGFKSGGFNSLGADIANNRLESVDPEDIWNYEFGLKSSWFDDRFQWNFSAYQYTYDDLQVLVLSGPSGAIPTYNIGNADAEGDGFETEFSWRVADQFRLHGNYSKLDSEYTRYDVNQFPGQTAANDLTGKEFSDQPDKWNLGFEYSTPLWNGDLLWYLNNTHVSSYISRNGIFDATVGGYDLMNTRVSYVPGHGGWEFAIAAQNLLDEEYLISLGGLGDAIGSPLTRRGKPRMVSVSFAAYF